METIEEVTKAKKTIPEYFDYGVISDSTYCNDFFEFRMSITAGHDAHYKKYDYFEKGFYEKDSVLAVPRLASSIVDHELLLIEPTFVKIDLVKTLKESGSIEGWQDYFSEQSNRKMFGADYQIVIRTHNLSGAPLGRYISQFENLHNPNYGESKTKTISGIPFREYQGMESRGDSMQQTMFALMGGKNKQISSYFTEINGFALSIDLFYLTEEQKCILLDMVDTIAFN